MSTLSERFDAVRADICDPATSTVHYPLLGILESSNNGDRAFNRAALEQNDIDPDLFLTTWATGFAKETLGMHGSHQVYREVEFSRCQTCLDTSTPDSFGHFISDDMRAQLLDKVAKLAPYCR